MPIPFTVHVDADVPLVMGDPEKIERMLQNLASNAIKFTPDGGCVILHGAYDRRAHVVTLSMTDNGIGIAAEDQQRIFERFVQVESTATRKYNGTGLGLALVREYGDMQGYTVSVESTVGEGSTFMITIPADSIVGDNDV